MIVIRYEGPKGGPGMREMLAPTSALIGAGLGDSVGLITDGRFSGAHARLGRRARCAGGRGGRRDCAWCAKAIPSPSTPKRAASNCTSRRKNWSAGTPPGSRPQPRYTTGVLAKYRRLVSSSSLGAVTDLIPTD